MSTAPRGMSIQEGYRLYREQALFVNRRYQRKLVWTEPEKARLIESIRMGYPIPLILLAEPSRTADPGKYEIIDGVQRLNAIFSFIENAFSVQGLYFDVDEFARAKQVADAGLFSIAASGTKLPRKDCADFLDYQLAVTIYSPADPKQVTDVFGRINSGGKQLSDQEQRQAGLATPFALLVRELAEQIRGDASREVVALSDMPEISIDSKRARQNYGLTAEDTFWCKQGILRNSQLRDSEDEEILADIAASILFGEPFARSRELLDDLYTLESDLFKKAENALAVYSATRLREEIKSTFSVLRETIEACSSERKLRAIVNPGSANPIKAAFYAIFMTFFDQVIKLQRSPTDPDEIMRALTDLQTAMARTAHYSTTQDRSNDIAKTTGLLQRYFAHREPPALSHGPGLALDFENSLRRSSIETGRYEFKQGLLRLSGDRAYDTDLVQRILETISGVANVGPESDGFIFIGVADKEQDAARIQQLDGITAAKIGQRYVVGIDREVKVLKTKTETYVEKILGAIRAADISEPLKTQVLSKIDVIEYRGKTVVRITVPAQLQVSFFGTDAFTRQNSQTVKVQGKQLLALNDLFQNRKGSF
jgi:hypothetical protein